jgi:hypothetical protein
MKDDFIAFSPLLVMSNDTTLPFPLPAAWYFYASMALQA